MACGGGGGSSEGGVSNKVPGDGTNGWCIKKYAEKKQIEFW